MKGSIHSFESMACADGPGVRSAIFFQGCPLRCLYCHNPDTQGKSGGQEYTAQELIQKVLPFKAYYGEQGGITLTGGEPLLQGAFCKELLKEAKKEGLHTVLDTSASAGEPLWEEILSFTDLALVDLKFTTEELYRTYCGGSLQKVLSFCALAEKMQVPLWIRHVVVPNLTDEDLPALLDLIAPLSNVKRVELLPFKKICAQKYQQLNRPFHAEHYPECPPSLIEELKATLPQQYL